MKNLGKVLIFAGMLASVQAYAANLTVVNNSGQDITAAITHVQCRLASQVKGFQFNTEKAKEAFNALKSSGDNPCDVKTIANGASATLTGKGLFISGFSLWLKDKDGKPMLGGKVKDVKAGSTATLSENALSYTDKKGNSQTLSY